MDSSATVKAAVQEKYGKAARGAGSGCCGGSGCDPITADLYADEHIGALPAEAVRASLGCGNPTALTDLRPGQVVLDLGSGGGIDVLLSARRVGPAGRVYGLDMTDEMLALARENARRDGATNVEFLKGDIEAIPLPDASVDVVISNCVINLAPDKPSVFREAFRVLRPEGVFAASDVVVRGEVAAEIRRSLELWTGCIAGALQDTEYLAMLEAAGFRNVTIEPWRVYEVTEAREFLLGAGLDPDSVDPGSAGAFLSAFIRATKPSPSACCPTTCCQ